MLKAMALHLQTRKDEFYRISSATGATKGDSWIDIDGGIGTFFVYASKGRRELPDERFFAEGPAEQISKNGTFLGRHVCVPLEGVAVHISTQRRARFDEGAADASAVIDVRLKGDLIDHQEWGRVVNLQHPDR